VSGPGAGVFFTQAHFPMCSLPFLAMPRLCFQGTKPPAYSEHQFCYAISTPSLIPWLSGLKVVGATSLAFRRGILGITSGSALGVSTFVSRLSMVVGTVFKPHHVLTLAAHLPFLVSSWLSSRLGKIRAAFMSRAFCRSRTQQPV
jgi:hypothetical protein